VDPRTEQLRLACIILARASKDHASQADFTRTIKDQLRDASKLAKLVIALDYQERQPQTLDRLRPMPN
jgi:hypothetical protein